MEQLKILIPVIICLVVSCRSPSEKVRDSFREVNESLEKTNKAADSLTQEIKLVGFDKSVELYQRSPMPLVPKRHRLAESLCIALRLPRDRTGGRNP